MKPPRAIYWSRFQQQMDVLDAVYKIKRYSRRIGVEPRAHVLQLEDLSWRLAADIIWC